jgi:hypothetical protein
MSPANAPRAVMLLCAGLAAVVAAALRLGTDVGGLGAVWDEGLMRPIVLAIVEGGWTVATLLDYQDTKGPVFFVLYAAWGEIAGTGLARLRLLSIACFVLAALPASALARRAGLDGRRTLLAVALLCLLPYHAVVGQLFMSEPSFVLGSLCLAAIAVRGLAPGRPGASWIEPLAFGLLLAVLLHHRVHVVALAGATLLAATLQFGRRSWPWWLAVVLAGLARLPLYVRWGGLVGSEYQDALGLGLRLSSLTYLAMAALPCTVTLLWPVLASGRPARSWIFAGALGGAVLGAVAVPDLSLPTEGHALFLGVIASALRPLASQPALLRLVIIALAALGTAALTATALISWLGEPGDDADETALTIERLAGGTLLVGWALYGLTRGVVFDRYLLPFLVLMPLLLVRRVPPWLLALQAVGLAVILGGLVLSWLLQP